MEHTPTWARLGLWRVTRHPAVRRCYELLDGAGAFVAQLDRFERETAAPVPDAEPPTGVEFSVSTVGEALPGHLEGAPLAPGDRVVRAERDGATVGCCCLSDRRVYVPELHRRLSFDGSYLWRLYVPPAERGRGIGTAIVARAVEAAAEAGEDRIVALVAPDNVPSRRAFRSLAFRPTERFTSVGLPGYRRHSSRPLGGDPTRE